MKRDIPSKIAVVGTGSIGLRHLNILKEIPGVEPVAIPKRAERRAALSAEGWTVCAGLAEAAEQGARTAVIASDSGAHAADALKALDCGMDLLVEKPLGVDAREALAVAEKAKGLGKKLWVGCVLRFSESLGLFREHLPKIGKIYSVRIECQSYLPDWRPNRPWRDSYSVRKGEGGVLRDLIHEIDYALWIFGKSEKVGARLKNTGQLCVAEEDFAEIFWETESGISVSLCLDYLSRIPRRRMTAFGAQGNLEWDGMARRTRLSLPEGTEEWQSAQAGDAMYRTQMEAFLKALCSEGSQGEAASGWDGVEALKVCDAARRVGR